MEHYNVLWYNDCKESDEMNSEIKVIPDTLFTDERRYAITELLKKTQKVSVQLLSERFKVSSATIRNDLRELETQGLLKRTHGGAMLKTKTVFELANEEKEWRRHEEKISIAQSALQLIEDGDCIILDTGTTTLELAKLLGQKKDLTVVVNDIKIAGILEQYSRVTVIMIGGVLRKDFHCTIGEWSCNMLKSLCVDIAFVAANGFSIEKGLTTPDLNHADVKRIMVSVANRVVLLCDSSKIGQDAFARFASVDEIDTLVTDEEIEKTQREDLKALGIKIITR